MTLSIQLLNALPVGLILTELCHVPSSRTGCQSLCNSFRGSLSSCCHSSAIFLTQMLALLATILHPTACFGSDASQFPSSNLFAAAGEGIWDNGAACGRQYLVRCISAVVPKTCIPGQTIQIRIVDRVQTSKSRPLKDGTTMVLSTTAFQTIANPSSTSMNVEFQLV
ncbi:hypothetical protein RJ639_015397 [Escallonia herrerae]|uniref:Expansin-like EG45 domain-containing protein n=1 Tax=Escallonia herrerae TaxID=1293975 RepID=A0AA89ANT2_9ASTE|nr:hypothetical protein RJ639_015397 [Escallonia herrerae]